MRVAVSGVNGFVGGHLVRELTEHGHDVIGLGIGAPAPGVADQLVDYLDQDLSVAWPSVAADAVVHLAGLSAVGPSFRDPQGYIHGNSAPVTHLCEGLLEMTPEGDGAILTISASWARTMPPPTAEPLPGVVRLRKESFPQIETLVERVAGAAMLVLTTSRPGYRPPWIDKSYAAQLSLHPLRDLPGRLELFGLDPIADTGHSRQSE